MSTLSQEFTTEKPFWHFLILGIVTGNVYFVYWMARSLERMSNTYSSVEGVFPGLVEKTKKQLWISVALMFFVQPVVLEGLYDSIITGEAMSTAVDVFLYGALTIANIVFWLMATFNMRKIFAHIFTEQNKHYEMKTLWTVLFSSVYLYYSVQQAEMNPKIQ